MVNGTRNGDISRVSPRSVSVLCKVNRLNCFEVDITNNSLFQVIERWVGIVRGGR